MYKYNKILGENIRIGDRVNLLPSSGQNRSLPYFSTPCEVIDIETRNTYKKIRVRQTDTGLLGIYEMKYATWDWVIIDETIPYDPKQQGDREDDI